MSLRAAAIYTSYTSTWTTRIRAHAPEILLYLLVRILGMCVLAAMAHHANVTGLLGKWDGVWYVNIAQHGYDTSQHYRADGSLVNTNIVFFPLYPLLIRVLGWPLGLLHAALVISWLSGIGAAVAIRTVGEHLYDRRTGIVLAVLWGIAPIALVESMAYTESLLTLLIALALLFLLRGQWIAAGISSFFAGLTHPTGLTIAAAIDVCALVTIVRHRRTATTHANTSTNAGVNVDTDTGTNATVDTGTNADANTGTNATVNAGTDANIGTDTIPGTDPDIAKARNGDRWRPWIGALLAPLGALGYLAWAGAELGRWDGWSYMQRQGWHNSPSASGTWHEVLLILTKPEQLGYYVALLVVLLAILSAAALTWGRPRAPLAVLVFTWVSIAAALMSGPTYFHSKARFLLPVFTLLLPLAIPLARQRLRTVVTLLGSGALVSAWYGGYLLTVWTRSP